MSFVNTKIIIDLVFMHIKVISYKFLNRAFKLIKIFCLKSLKINLNIVSKTVVFSVYSCILVRFIYCIFVKEIMVNYFNFYAIVKEDF